MEKSRISLKRNWVERIIDFLMPYSANKKYSADCLKIEIPGIISIDNVMPRDIKEFTRQFNKVFKNAKGKLCIVNRPVSVISLKELKEIVSVIEKGMKKKE